jgi:hypothetical protein
MAGMDENHVWGFDQDVARALKVIAGVENPEVGQGQLGRGAGYIVKVPTGGITKRSGTTVTVVDCQAYYLDGTGGTRTLTDAGFAVPVGNMSDTTDVAQDTYVMPSWRGGLLVVDIPKTSFDVRVNAGYTRLQKSTDGGATWTDWATIAEC